MSSMFGLMATPGANSVSRVHLEIPLLINADVSNTFLPAVIQCCLFYTGCEKDVQRVWVTSSQEYVHPFKEKMEVFISNGKPCIKSLCKLL